MPGCGALRWRPTGTYPGRAVGLLWLPLFCSASHFSQPIQRQLSCPPSHRAARRDVRAAGAAGGLADDAGQHGHQPLRGALPRRGAGLDQVGQGRWVPSQAQLERGRNSGLLRAFTSAARQGAREEGRMLATWRVCPTRAPALPPCPPSGRPHALCATLCPAASCPPSARRWSSGSWCRACGSTWRRCSAAATS